MSPAMMRHFAHPVSPQNVRFGFRRLFASKKSFGEKFDQAFACCYFTKLPEVGSLNLIIFWFFPFLKCKSMTYYLCFHFRQSSISCGIQNQTSNRPSLCLCVPWRFFHDFFHRLSQSPNSLTTLMFKYDCGFCGKFQRFSSSSCTCPRPARRSTGKRPRVSDGSWTEVRRRRGHSGWIAYRPDSCPRRRKNSGGETL